MKKQFYSHLIEIESMTVVLDELELNDEEKMELSKLADATLHHTILDAILSELSEEDKQEFLMQLRYDNHGRIWELLNKKIDNVEEKIKKTAQVLKAEIHEDLKEAKKLKGGG